MNASQLRFQPRETCNCCVLVWLENVRASHQHGAPRVLIQTMMYASPRIVGAPPFNEQVAARLNELAEPLNEELRRYAGDPV